jgi:predicted acetyltransferase
MTRYIKRCMAYSYNISNKDINNDNLCKLFQHVYENKKSFINTTYLYLNNFEQSISTPNKSGEIVINYYDNNENIGVTQYNIKSGEIGLILINKEYRGKTLGKQIITNIIHDMKLNNINEVWVQAPNNHIFWSNVFNKSFTFRTPISLEKGGRGYFMNL